MLYDTYASLVYTVCFRYSKNVEDAQDMLQETFINVFGNLDRFEGNGSFEGWIRKIAVNCAIRQYHKSAKRIDTGDIEHQPDAESYSDVMDTLGAEEIMKVINKLPDGYRMVFNMYAIEGYSHKEISEAIGITESASRSQLTRARKQLMEMTAIAETTTQGA